MEDERDISRRPLPCLVAQQSPRSCAVPTAPVVLKLKEGRVSESQLQLPRCMIHIPVPGSHVGRGCPAGRHRCGTLRSPQQVPARASASQAWLLCSR